jgi:RNA polymerase sigma factor (sigma-70 family)
LDQPEQLPLLQMWDLLVRSTRARYRCDTACAEDTVQQAYLRLLEHGIAEAQIDILKWHNAIRNVAYSKHRGLRREIRKREDYHKPNEKSEEPDERLLELEFKDCLCACIAELSSIEQEIIRLRGGSAEQPWKDIAGHLSITEGVVRKRYSRAKVKVKECLRRKGVYDYTSEREESISYVDE